jgi:hypothetical protein
MLARALPMRPSFFALFRRARFTIVNIIIIAVVIIIVIIIVVSVVVIIIIILILIIITTTIMRTPTPLHIERHACAPQHER